MTSDEDTLAALYTQRQEILKDLAEVDANIRRVEFLIHVRSRSVSKKVMEENKSGNGDFDKVNEIIARCVSDAAGLRDAVRMVETCRYIQDMASFDDDARKKTLFRNAFVHECIRNSLELANDANGSELMQNLLPLLLSGTESAEAGNLNYDPSDSTISTSEILLLIKTLDSNLVVTACTTNGARVTQRIVECLKTDEEYALFVDKISPSIVELAKDINGNHSLSKLITSTNFIRLCTPEDGESLEKTSQRMAIERKVFDEISANCVDICKNRQGCCIIQKCLQNAPKQYCASIISKVLSNSLKLVQDPFGNYVIQFLLDRKADSRGAKASGAAEDDESTTQNYTNQIIRQLLHHVAELSCNKFSSNVIEKCLRRSSPDVRQLLVDELTEPHVLPKLLTDNFANYVIQTAISTASSEDQFTQLRDSIIPLQELLKNSPYGVKIEGKLSKRTRATAHRQSAPAETTATQQTHVVQDSMVPHYVPHQSIPAIQIMAQDSPMGPVAFTSIPHEMASLFQPQQQILNMPFMFPGQQMIGIPNTQPPPPPPPPPPSFTMSVMNGSTLPEYH